MGMIGYGGHGLLYMDVWFVFVACGVFFQHLLYLAED